MTEPIYALDLDEEFLSHLSDADSWVVIQGEGITDDIIEDAEVAVIFQWTKQHIRAHGIVPAASVLAEEFDLDLRPPETAIGDLLDRMRERYMKNQGRQALRSIVELQNEDPLQVPQALLRKGRELNALLSKRGEMFGTGDVERAKRRYDLKVMAGPGASFVHKDLDEYFYGMLGLTFWIAPPKTYKSWQMLQGLVSNAEQGRCTWLYSLELPAEESDMRLRCLLADVPYWHYLRNDLTVDDWKRIRKASEIIDGCGIYKIVKPPAGQRGIDEMVHVARDAGAEVIFIDQLQYVENEKGLSLGSLNNTGDYWNVLNKARDLSDDGPLCIAHQFNRQAMFTDKMPAVELAKGSSALEETATLALGMWANKDMRRSGILEVGTLIARNHQYAAWEMQVELSRGCDFTIIGRAPEETNED